MIRSEISLVIPGVPATKGSLKCVGSRGGRGHQLLEQLPTTKPWVEKIARLAGIQLTDNGRSADPRQPIGVECTFTLPRPQSHYGTGRNAGRVKKSSPTHPTGHDTGDSDKYVRAILDALQSAGVLVDDSQVVEQSGRKVYLAPDALAGSDVLGFPGVVVRIYPIGD